MLSECSSGVVVDIPEKGPSIGYPGLQCVHGNTPKTEFYIEQLQPWWLPEPDQRRVYKIISRWGFGLVIGLVVGLTVAIAVAVMTTLITTLWVGLILGGLSGIVAASV